MMETHAFEESARFGEEAFAKEGAADLQHEFVIVVEAEFDELLEGAERALDLAEDEECFADAGEGVFMFGVEDEGGVECATGPRVFLAGKKLCVADADMEFDRLWVTRISPSRRSARASS